MASLAAATVGSSCSMGALSHQNNGVLGKKLISAPNGTQATVGKKATGRGSMACRAKYGEKSVYFDLDDVANTTGAWDLYGSDAPSPYNGLQSKFFETFGGAFTKRGLLLKFLILGGGGTLAYVSSSATRDVLPIKNGPQQPPKLGPRGKI